MKSNKGNLTPPLVSVIMPAYNASHYIRESIESVLIQSYTNWELIVADDCSVDGTPEIVKFYSARDPRIKYVELSSNSGSPSGPRNKALALAKGEYVAFLDSDDLWNENKLLNQLTFMINNNYEFTCSSYDIISENGAKLGNYYPPEKADYSSMLQNNSVGCLTAIVKKELIDNHFFPNCGHEDYALWLTLIKKAGAVYACKEVLASYRKVANSVSSNKIKVFKFFWHIYRHEERLDSFTSLYYCLRYFVNALWFKYS